MNAWIAVCKSIHFGSYYLFNNTSKPIHSEKYAPKELHRCPSSYLTYLCKPYVFDHNTIRSARSNITPNAAYTIIHIAITAV